MHSTTNVYDVYYFNLAFFFSLYKHGAMLFHIIKNII